MLREPVKRPASPSPQPAKALRTSDNHSPAQASVQEKEVEKTEGEHSPQPLAVTKNSAPTAATQTTPAAPEEPSPLMKAINENNSLLVQQLIQQDKNSILRPSKFGYTALHYCAARGHSELLDTMIDALDMSTWIQTIKTPKGYDIAAIALFNNHHTLFAHIVKKYYQGNISRVYHTNFFIMCLMEAASYEAISLFDALVEIYNTPATSFDKEHCYNALYKALVSGKPLMLAHMVNKAYFPLRPYWYQLTRIGHTPLQMIVGWPEFLRLQFLAGLEETKRQEFVQAIAALQPVSPQQSEVRANQDAKLPQPLLKAVKYTMEQDKGEYIAVDAIQINNTVKNFTPTAYPIPFKVHPKDTNPLNEWLHFHSKNKELIKASLKNGDYLLCDKDGLTPLHRCAENINRKFILEEMLNLANEQHKLTINTLVTHAPKSDLTHKEGYWTIAHHAAWNKKDQVLARLAVNEKQLNWLQGPSPSMTIVGIMACTWKVYDIRYFLSSLRHSEEVCQRFKEALFTVAPSLRRLLEKEEQQINILPSSSASTVAEEKSSVESLQLLAEKVAQQAQSENLTEKENVSEHVLAQLKNTTPAAQANLPTTNFHQQQVMRSKQGEAETHLANPGGRGF